MQPQHTPATETVHVPLYRRDGTVAGYTIIDQPDATMVMHYTWRLNAHGHACRWVRDRTLGQRTIFYLHRVLLGLPAKHDGREVDHINRNGLDNRRANLRIISHAENMQNRPKHHGRRSQGGAMRSEYRGVYWERRTARWRAAVRIDGQVVRLGYFTDEAAAGEAARLARERLMPFAVD